MAGEAAWAQQSRVKYIRPVGSRDDNNVGTAIEAVHFNQYLVQGLLPFVMASTKSGAAVSAHSVYLIDEDNTRCIVLGLVKEVSDTGSTDAHEHLYELTAAARE